MQKELSLRGGCKGKQVRCEEFINLHKKSEGHNKLESDVPAHVVYADVL